MSYNNNSFPPGFGHGRHAPVQCDGGQELGGRLHAGFGHGRDAPLQRDGGRGFQDPEGLRDLGARGLEGGYQDAAMEKYLSGGALVGVGGGGLSRGADAMGGYHRLGGSFGGGGGQPQLNVQQLLD